MVGGASVVDFPLHADIRLLAQRCRRLFCQADEAATCPWRVPIGRGTQRRDRTVPQRKQSRPTAVPMDKKAQQNFGRRKTRAPSVRFYPLAEQNRKIFVRRKLRKVINTQMMFGQ